MIENTPPSAAEPCEGQGRSSRQPPKIKTPVRIEHLADTDYEAWIIYDANDFELTVCYVEESAVAMAEAINEGEEDRKCLKELLARIREVNAERDSWRMGSEMVTDASLRNLQQLAAVEAERDQLRLLLTAICWNGVTRVSTKAIVAVSGPLQPSLEIFEDSDNRCTVIRLACRGSIVGEANHG